MKNLQEVLPSQTSHPSIEIACSMRRPSRRPNAIQAELQAPMRPRGTEGSNPVPSSGESGANLSLAGIAFLRREAAVFRGCAGRGERRGRQRRAGRGNIGPTGGNISVGPYSSTAPPVDVGGLMIPVV